MRKSTNAIRSIGQDINLPGGQRLQMSVDGDDTILKVNAAGKTMISIRITKDGAELIFEDGLQLRTQGNLTLDGDRVTFRAREELRLESDGEVNICAKGDLNTEGQIQNIRAKLGNVNVKANDDVKLRAERILLNT
ncbi:MAG: hypothetical protein WBS20_11690 [Lysobacterales bacterium]